MRKFGCLVALLVASSALAAPKSPSFLQVVHLPRTCALARTPAATAVNAFGGVTVHASDHGTLALKPDYGRGPMAALEFKF